MPRVLTRAQSMQSSSAFANHPVEVLPPLSPTPRTIRGSGNTVTATGASAPSPPGFHW